MDGLELVPKAIRDLYEVKEWRHACGTLSPGRRQVNIIVSRKREHSRKPDELFEIIERCSPGPYLELFARYAKPGWYSWGDMLPGGLIEPGASRVYAHRPRFEETKLRLPAKSNRR